MEFQYWPEKRGGIEVSAGNGNRIYSSVVLDKLKALPDSSFNFNEMELDYFKDADESPTCLMRFKRCKRGCRTMSYSNPLGMLMNPNTGSLIILLACILENGFQLLGHLCLHFFSGLAGSLRKVFGFVHIDDTSA